jgi:uncharacterized protein (DUF1501 family)
VPLPPKLFSHNDQQSVWQASAAEGATTGWGGRMGDLFEAANERSTFTCVNVSGNAVFMSGRRAVQYQVTSTGSVALNGVRSPLFGSAAASEALRSLVTAQRPHLMQAEHARTAARAIDAHETLTAALATGPTLATAFPTGNTLADQLRMVARMIGSAGALGARRQVFFVSLGGFDNHDALMTTHTQLLGRVGSALAAFQDALTELRVADRVTTFTASDFGRTLTGNNDGSDHGWGSVQFVLGGAVAGGRPGPAVAHDGGGPDGGHPGQLVWPVGQPAAGRAAQPQELRRVGEAAGFRVRRGGQDPNSHAFAAGRGPSIWRRSTRFQPRPASPVTAAARASTPR